MTKKRRRVQERDIILINEAYAEIGTYAGAARATGWSPSTVKRYVIQDYIPKKNIEEQPKETQEFDILPKEELQYPDNWRETMQLTDDELQGIKEIQKTILV